MEIFRTLLCLFVVSGLFSCQAPISPFPSETLQSQGSLQKDANDSCSNITVAGSYVAGIACTDSNYIEVLVSITVAGNYSITTDTVNGYYFAAAGIFNSRGNFSVRLQSHGTPIVSGSNFFTVSYNNSYCNFFIAVANNNAAAAYSFDGAPNICSNDTVSGTYVNNVTLDSTAQVIIHVLVDTAGTYTISTDTVNGYYFSGSGIFVSTGLQTVLLHAAGTPQHTGEDIFTVGALQPSCSFSVNVLTPVTVSGDEYFPLTKNSYWTYDDLVHIGDTIKRTIIDTMIILGNVYNIMNEQVRFGGPYEYFYRKENSSYLEHAAPNKFTTFFQYKEPVNADIPFLQEGLTTGAAWETPEYIDTASDGNIIFLKYDLGCIDANATVTLGNHAFANVYKITLLPQVKITSGDYNFTGESYLFYYAKGIGLIYLQKKLSGFVQTEWQIRNWQVN